MCVKSAPAPRHRDMRYVAWWHAMCQCVDVHFEPAGQFRRMTMTTVSLEMLESGFWNLCVYTRHTRDMRRKPLRSQQEKYIQALACFTAQTADVVFLPFTTRFPFFRDIVFSYDYAAPQFMPGQHCSTTAEQYVSQKVLGHIIIVVASLKCDKNSRPLPPPSNVVASKK